MARLSIGTLLDEMKLLSSKFDVTATLRGPLNHKSLHDELFKMNAVIEHIDLSNSP